MAPMSIGAVLMLAVYAKNLWTEKALNPFHAHPSSAHAFLKITSLVFAVSCLISLAAAQLFPPVYGGETLFPNWGSVQKLWFLIVPFAISRLWQRQLNAEKIIRIWWSATCILSIVAVIQFFTGWPRGQWIPHFEQYYHATLFLGHHLSTASVFLFPTLTAFAVAAFQLIKHRKVDRLATTTAFSGLLILFLTFSRTAWAATPIACFFILMVLFSNRARILSLVALVLTAGGAYQIPIIYTRLHFETGVSERFELWKMSFQLFKDRPFTGVGWLQVQHASEFYFKGLFPETYHQKFWGHAHNIFFEMLAGTGLIGFISWLGIVAFPFYFGWKLYKNTTLSDFWRGLSLGIVAAWIGILINGMTQVNFWEGKVAHQIMISIGILLALSSGKTKNA